MKNIYIALLCMFCINVAWAQKGKHDNDLRVIIIRHGEKPDKGDNLSCRGFNRALQLPAVLVKSFGVPNYVYVPAPSLGKATKSDRMMQTIAPLAIKYNLAINSKFSVDQTAALGANILKRSGTVVVVWEHDNAPGIADALGVKGQKLKWPGSDYDSIWIVTIKNGKAKLTTAQEGITPSDNCSF